MGDLCQGRTGMEDTTLATDTCTISCGAQSKANFKRGTKQIDTEIRNLCQTLGEQNRLHLSGSAQHSLPLRPIVPFQEHCRTLND